MVGKRKRSDRAEDDEQNEVNGDNKGQQLHRFHNWLSDALTILRTQDTSPSSFDCPITSTSQADRDAKRAKLTEKPEQCTISSLVETRSYGSIEEVIKDLEIATSGITEELQEALDGDQSRYIARESRSQMALATALRKELDRLIQREMIRQPGNIVTAQLVKEEPSEDEDVKFRGGRSTDNVLTLLSSNQPPKQLFTSLRKPNALNSSIDDVALPNGITTTKITPQHSLNENGKLPVPTFKDTFPPPSSLPPLTIPKQSKHTATRSSSVNWYNPSENESKPKPNRRDIHSNQGLSTGQWLKYSVAPSPSQLASPESKRKQRDRALSAGEPQTAISQEAIESHNQAKDDALYRSVYSTFAPGRDDFGALVPEPQKNRIWWDKYGEARYNDILGLRNDGLEEVTRGEMNDAGDDEPLDEAELEDAIAKWKPEDPLQEMQKTKVARNVPPENPDEADKILEEISDLLETLQSHQRIRNLTFTNNARPMAGQTPQATSTAGSPTSPSTAEFDVYELLQSQLALIVSTLPPYLLSKLDSDKLGALNVSTKILVEGKNQRGMLEESEAAATARRAATPTAVPVTGSQAPSAYSNVPGRNNSYMGASTPAQQYARAGYGVSTAPRPAVNASYLQNPQYSNRPASSTYASSTARPPYPSHQGYPAQAPATSSTPRYNYTQQYGQQAQSYGGYQNGYRPYSSQNANNYNYNSQLTAPHARTPVNSAQASSQAYRGSATDYQQRAVPPQGYGYGSAQGSGSATPLNPQRLPHSSQTAQAPAPHRPPLYHQYSSQYKSETPGSPQVNGTASNGSPAPPARMTPDEQTTAITKQKAQLTERQSRQGSGTPQPGSRQYTPQQDAGQQNGGPLPQQNGIAAG